jgi:ribosome recycling factor
MQKPKLNYRLDLMQLGRNHSQLHNLIEQRKESVLNIRKSKHQRSARKTQNGFSNAVSPRIELNELEKLGKDIAKKVENILKIQKYQGKANDPEHT